MDKKVKGRLTELKKELEPGDIILYGPQETGDPLNRMFLTFSRPLQGDFTHAGIYVGDNKTVESFAGRPIKEYDLDSRLDGRRDITVMKPKLSAKTKNRAAAFAKKQVGKPYSYKDLAMHGKYLLLPKKQKNFLKTDKAGRNAYSCSTLVTQSYRAAGARVVDTDVEVAAPVDLVSSSRNDVYFTSKRPPEKIPIITSAGKAAKKKVTEFFDAVDYLVDSDEKVAESISFSEGSSMSNLNGDITFSGHKIMRNGELRGVKYKGHQSREGLLRAKIEKVSGLSPAMLQQLSNQAGTMYTVSRAYQDADVPTRYREARDGSRKIKDFSRKKYQEYRKRGFRKKASEQNIYTDSKLKIVAHPEAYRWMPPRDIIQKLGQFMHKEMCIRIFPRDMIFEVYNDEHPACLGEEDYYKFRAYTSGSKATVFVDETETPDSVLWVILHELAHMDMKASSYLYKAYTWATPEDYNESDEAHERDPEEQMANLVATKWLGRLGREEFCYSRPWWRARVETHCSMEKDASFRISDPYDTMRYTDGNLSSLSDRELAEAIRRESKDASKNDFFISTTDKGLAKSQLLKLENEKKRRLEKQARVEAHCSMEKDAGFFGKMMATTTGNYSNLSPEDLNAMKAKYQRDLGNDVYLASSPYLEHQLQNRVFNIEQELARRSQTKTAGAGLVLMQRYYAEHPDLLRDYLSRAKKGIKKTDLRKEAAEPGTFRYIADAYVNAHKEDLKFWKTYAVDSRKDFSKMSTKELQEMKNSNQKSLIHSEGTFSPEGRTGLEVYKKNIENIDQELSKRQNSGMNKQAANVIALAAGVAVGTVAVYDYFKSRGMESAAKTVEEEISKKQVNSKQYIRSKDPRVKVITNLAEAKSMLNEIKDKADRDMTERQLSTFFSTGESNAFAFRAKGEYIIAHPKCNSIALDHELGHIHDFRAQNISMLGKHKYNKDPLKQFLFKKNYREGMYQAEVEAWDRAKIKEDHRLRSAALDTYDKSFHRNRMSVAAPTALGLLLYGAK